ncbi:hypothetical protein CkaCkLH20_02601 [Colletotrichum karsti]|uniref:Uncharacterized protein n=1 Tax=Colletotrichum karsti TaxID=1095194 RepID=A0A9P6II98_9PEZI|nr:uncharacterized protein CkaCkLH20_02601 [Colletotrichum karsti]KAF9879790.1 hypothetical protein CkaCkLH20_02601 [Colletotrichum karsti]
MFKSVSSPPKIQEEYPKQRSAVTTPGTVSPDPDLPSTWKLTLSSSSSLKVAIEEAARAMEKKEIKDTNTSDVPIQVLMEKKQTDTLIVEPKLKELPPRPVQKENTPPPHQSHKKSEETPTESNYSIRTENDDKDIDNRDVLRGLNIAISAACDEEVDAWIREKTGVRIRRFLADLRAFESLAEDDTPDPMHERARIRRAGSRKLKAQIRQSRAAREARQL